MVTAARARWWVACSTGALFAIACLCAQPGAAQQPSGPAARPTAKPKAPKSKPAAPTNNNQPAPGGAKPKDAPKKAPAAPSDAGKPPPVIAPPAASPKLAPLPPVDTSAPPPQLPRASRERMRACAEEWEKKKGAAKTGLPMWREFAAECLTR